MRPLILGDSHATHLALSLGQIDAQITPDNCGIFLDVHKNDAIVAEYVLSDHRRSIFRNFEDAAYLDPVFRDHLRDKSRQYSFCVLSLGNFFHNDFFIKRDPVFDFYDKRVPIFFDSAQIIPRNVILDHFRQRLAFLTKWINALTAEIPKIEFFFLGCPPPISSDERINSLSEIDGGLKDFKVTANNKFIRLKCYHAFIQIQKEIAHFTKINFIDTSTHLVDEYGFLMEEYWHGCSHATPEYYSKLLAIT